MTALGDEADGVRVVRSEDVSSESWLSLLGLRVLFPLPGGMQIGLGIFGGGLLEGDRNVAESVTTL